MLTSCEGGGQGVRHGHEPVSRGGGLVVCKACGARLPVAVEEPTDVVAVAAELAVAVEAQLEVVEQMAQPRGRRRRGR